MEMVVLFDYALQVPIFPLFPESSVSPTFSSFFFFFDPPVLKLLNRFPHLLSGNFAYASYPFPVRWLTFTCDRLVLRCRPFDLLATFF